MVSALGGKGRSTGGIEQERQLGHRKTQAFGVRLTWLQDTVAHLLYLLCDFG